MATQSRILAWRIPGMGEPGGLPSTGLQRVGHDWRNWAAAAAAASILGFPGGSDGKEFSCKLGDLGPIPGLGRSPGEGKGHPLQYSCLKNPHGQRSLAGHSLCSCRVRDDWAAKPSTEWTSQVVLVVENPLPMQGLEVQPLGWGDPQEEDTAT